MKRSAIVLAATVLCVLFAVVSAFGAQVTLFEKTYIRETQKPQVFSDTFTAPDPMGRYTLIVKNGKNPTNRVSSAVITLNGTRVLGPSDFNQGVNIITRTVKLKRENVLTVELRSKPGSFVVLTMVGEMQTTPPALPAAFVGPVSHPWPGSAWLFLFLAACRRAGRCGRAWA